MGVLGDQSPPASPGCPSPVLGSGMPTPTNSPRAPSHVSTGVGNTDIRPVSALEDKASPQELSTSTHDELTTPPLSRTRRLSNNDASHVSTPGPGGVMIRNGSPTPPDHPSTTLVGGPRPTSPSSSSLLATTVTTHTRGTHNHDISVSSPANDLEGFFTPPAGPSHPHGRENHALDLHGGVGSAVSDGAIQGTPVSTASANGRPQPQAKVLPIEEPALDPLDPAEVNSTTNFHEAPIDGASGASLICPSCGKMYSDPRLLHCLHSICLACGVDNEIQGTISCPVCDTVTNLSRVTSSSVEGLPQNPVLVRAVSHENMARANCAECAETKASVFCQQCDAALCDSCSQRIHKSRILSGHTLVPIEQRADHMPEGMCCVHPEEEVKFFCADDATLLCRDCIILGDHKVHSYVPLDRASVDIRERLRGHVSGLLVKGRELAQVQQTMDARLPKLKQSRDAVVQAVNDNFDRIISMALERKAQLLQRVEDVTDGQIAGIESNLRVLSIVQSRIHATCANASRLLATASPLESITLRPYITKRMNELTELEDGLHQMKQVHDSTLQFVADESLVTRITNYGHVQANQALHEFTHEYDFDENGILYFLGTDLGRSTQWRNPSQCGIVGLSASSVADGQISQLTARSPLPFRTKNQRFSWISIDFGRRFLIRPTAYTLRHGDRTARYCLRSWDLEASVDGNDWTVLMSHRNDTALNGAFASHTWHIPTCDHAYRLFRVMMMGEDASGTAELNMSSIEFYGQLYVRDHV